MVMGQGATIVRPEIIRLIPVVLVFFVVACFSQPFTVTREPVSLRLVAADSCGPLAEELAAAYGEARPWVVVHVETFNSSVAERTLRTGGLDLALLSWLPGSADEDALWSQPFARDGIAIIVHPGVPLTDIGLGYLQEIFRGRIQEWEGVVLTVVSREEGSGTRAAFENVILGGYGVAPTGVVMPSSEAVIEYVARTPGGVGYVSTLWLSQPIASGVRVLSVEGVLPGLDALSNNEYPLARSLYLVSNTEPAGEAREFVQWLLGPEGQAIVNRLGY